MATHENLIRQVEAALEHDPATSFQARRLKLTLDSAGALVLEGEVENIAAKKLALEHAAAVPGVSGIVDRVRVAPSRRMTDKEIRDHIRDAVIEEPAMDPCTIRVFDGGRFVTCRESSARPRCAIDITVNDGVITLDGQVSSLSHKRLAGVLAWWVPGSRDVVNGLEVAPEETDSDAEITEAVKLALDKDPLVNAYRIRASTRNAVVTLEGDVANNAEKEMAAYDAWYTFGVDKVVNNLTVRR
jgi:osmotically-inducible protein OsmY